MYGISKVEMERVLKPLCSGDADNLFGDPLLNVNPENIGKEDNNNSKKRKETRYPDILEVFEYWKAVCRHPDAQLDKTRSNAIARQLIDYNRTVDELKRAIDGASTDPFLQGQNSSGKRYDDIGLILRDAAHVERYVEASKRHKRETDTLMSGLDGAEAYADIYEDILRQEQE